MADAAVSSGASRLFSGRVLTFLDAGPPDGYPVVYFHGIPSSSAEWRMWGTPELLGRAGIRLLSVDRPGVGGSSHDRHRTIASTGRDLAELADRLGLDRFGVLSYSGGAAYAMSLATDPRCERVGVVSPMLPLSPELTVGLNPETLRFLMLARRRVGPFGLAYRGTTLLWRRAPEKFVANAVASFGEADRAEFSRPEVHGPMMSTRGTPGGQRLDVALAITPWNLDLARITSPVDIWQGDEDHNVSVAMARRLASDVPGSRLHVLHGEGHISLPVRHAPQILGEFIAA